MIEYRRHDSEDMERPLKPGPVLHWADRMRGDAVIFSCPCGAREIFATTENGHKISFDDEGRLTIRGSLGAHPRPQDGYPEANWCHAYVTDGVFEVLDDSICPGRGRTW